MSLCIFPALLWNGNRFVYEGVFLSNQFLSLKINNKNPVILIFHQISRKPTEIMATPNMKIHGYLCPL